MQPKQNSDVANDVMGQQEAQLSLGWPTVSEIRWLLG